MKNKQTNKISRYDSNAFCMKVIIQNLVKMFEQRWDGAWESKFSPR